MSGAISGIELQGCPLLCFIATGPFQEERLLMEDDTDVITRYSNGAQRPVLLLLHFNIQVRVNLNCKKQKKMENGDF